ncbi:MAG: hypothetical protein DA328_00750 [Nitrososphaeraceae archaeon]|nr:hypothetical protein [Nitrososphaeraceae archaeon]
MIKKENRTSDIVPRKIEDVFENFRKDIESIYSRWWKFPFGEISFPTLSEKDTLVPLCDMEDKGDRYEVQVDVPGIEKDRLNIKATKNSVEIEGEQKEKTEEKGKDYVYNERSYHSIYRKIPIPEEIIPSQIEAKMNNGILSITMPKKTPTKIEEESTKVEIN